jgi:hypothetical protein
MMMNKDFLLVSLATAMLLSIFGMLPLRALGFSAMIWAAVFMFCKTGVTFLADPPRESACVPCGLIGILFTGLAVVVLAV